MRAGDPPLFPPHSIAPVPGTPTLQDSHRYTCSEHYRPFDCLVISASSIENTCRIVTLPLHVITERELESLLIFFLVLSSYQIQMDDKRLSSLYSITGIIYR